MNILVSSQDIVVTRALKEFAKKQALKLKKFNQKILKININLKNKKKLNLVKYQIKLPGKQIVVARKAIDMYQAIVDATRSAMRHVRKNKEKKIKR